MKMVLRCGALGVVVAAMLLVGACSPGLAPPAPASAPTLEADVPTAVTLGSDPRLNPTAAVGGGVNASNVITADDILNVFKSVPQASQLKVTANSSPPGAKGSDVQSVSVNCQDVGGVLKTLDATAKQTFGDALLTAAGTAWPNASVSLLVSDPSGAGGQIIGTRSPGGPNTVF